MAEGEENRTGAAGEPTGSASTLLTTVETVRCAMRADTASIASFSLEERRITWLAMSGFEHVGPGVGPFVTPLRGEFAERAALVSDPVIEVRGLAGDLPASEFPLHSAEGVRDILLAPLVARGESLGVLAVGYRTPQHRLSAEDRQQLEGLAAMAALALDNARLLETLGTAKRVWEQTFDAIPDGIIVHDDRLTVARCNMAAAEAMSLHPSEVAGLSCSEVFARLFGERAAAYHMKAGTARTTNSFELQAEDGRRYLVAVAPLTNPDAGVSEGRPPDADASWSVVTWSDITTLAEVQEQLARSRRLATIGQLAAGVAHEINNPLAAVTTCAEATLRDLRSAPETARLADERGWGYYLEEIVRQALRCKQITSGLLDLARQKRPRREAVDLNSVVEHTARLFEERARGTGASVRVSLDPGVGEVATDEVMVRQILDNLLSNALDALGDGGGAVELTTALDGGRVRVEVRDEGPGIPPDVLARVFDPFFTTKEPGQGTGLGLAISLTFAESIGGALTAESKPGAGSRFRLWLPRRAPDRG
jgi:nitrogen fixation/metabolism regulation signal transduction histidine kinase